MLERKTGWGKLGGLGGFEELVRDRKRRLPVVSCKSHVLGKLGVKIWRGAGCMWSKRGMNGLKTGKA